MVRHYVNVVETDKKRMHDKASPAWLLFGIRQLLVGLVNWFNLWVTVQYMVVNPQLEQMLLMFM
jgi:hypothetical protein